MFGQPSGQNTYADIEAAYKCLTEYFGVLEENIILYGQSVGSGPTVDLASRRPNLGAVVIHSGFLSCLRVRHPARRACRLDSYKVKCPFSRHVIHYVFISISHQSRVLVNYQPKKKIQAIRLKKMSDTFAHFFEQYSGVVS